MSKNFGKEFDNILNLARSRDAFCFTRFSDGEVTILRNQPLILGDGFFLQGDIHGNLRIAVPRQTYSEEEQKRFIPEESPFIYEKLTEAFKYRKKNYFKGIPPQNSLDGSASWKFCIDLYGSGDEEHLTFSNVLTIVHLHILKLSHPHILTFSHYRILNSLAPFPNIL